MERREGTGQSRIWLDCFVVRVTDTGLRAMFETPDPYGIGGLLELPRESPGDPVARGDEPR